MPPETIRRVCKYRLNKRGRRSGKKKKSDKKSINHGNLIEIKDASTNKVSHTRNLNIALLNCQSVKNKDQLMADYMCSEKIDICVVTEMWLTEQ